jgi:hypothetical protein
MSELSLEPFAARVYFYSQGDLPAGEGQKTLADYLEAIAAKCDAGGDTVIGHIKAIALFADGTYFRVGVVSAQHPAETDGNSSADITDAKITLNVLVYNLSRNRLQQIIQESASEVNKARQGEIKVVPVGLHVIHQGKAWLSPDEAK